MVIREAMSSTLGRIVGKVYQAENGEEGLERFRAERPDMVVSDIMMPYMDGLEMAEIIKNDSPDTPVILITASNDTANLVKAIDIGVEKFVVKPVDREKMRSVLYATGDYLLEKRELQKSREVLRKSRERELELLRLQERYHEAQQVQAFEKQLMLLKDELSHTGDGSYLYETYYHPQDILSGDTYGACDLGGGKRFFYVLDAMGKGLSASVTATQSASFINHLLDEVGEGLDFPRFLETFQGFISKGLLPDEMLCSLFALMDTESKKLQVASYGMPPVLYQRLDGTIGEIVANNRPIMPFFTGNAVEELDMEPVEKILFYSDGLIESETEEGGLYRELETDFAQCLTGSMLRRRIEKAIRLPEDDITFIMIRKGAAPTEGKRSIPVAGGLQAIDDALDEIRAYITKEAGLQETLAEKALFALTELLINAVEHGNLGIDKEEKNQLIGEGSFDRVVAELEESGTNREKEITVTLELPVLEGRPCFAATVEDRGSGFNPSRMFKSLNFPNTTAFNGRGILMSAMAADGLYYNREGNRVTIYMVGEPAC